MNDEHRCYATIDLGNKGVVACSKPKHSSDEQHYSHRERMRWLDGEGFKSLVNGDGNVVDDPTPSEHSPELVSGNPTVGGALRRGLLASQGADVDGDVESAARSLVSAIRAESQRELGDATNLKAEINYLRLENERLRKTINDAGSVIVAAVGSIGEPREWSVKETPRYRETYLGPKRARQWRAVTGMGREVFDATWVKQFLGVTHEAASSLLRDAEREGKAERVSKGVYRVAR